MEKMIQRSLMDLYVIKFFWFSMQNARLKEQWRVSYHMLFLEFCMPIFCTCHGAPIHCSCYLQVNTGFPRFVSHFMPSNKFSLTIYTSIASKPRVHLFMQLPGIARMFSNKMTVASAWIHLLVVDLFAARFRFVKTLLLLHIGVGSISFCRCWCI